MKTIVKDTGEEVEIRKVVVSGGIYHDDECYYEDLSVSAPIDRKKARVEMEDLDKIKVRDYTKVEELNVMEEKKLNLKPFDIQKAREGKPVCTRDGRQARIICFDAKDTQPIIGLYEKNIDGIVREYLCSYHTDGSMYDDQDTGYDLMMLPEKKEGWAKFVKILTFMIQKKKLIEK